MKNGTMSTPAKKIRTSEAELKARFGERCFEREDGKGKRYYPKIQPKVYRQGYCVYADQVEAWAMWAINHMEHNMRPSRPLLEPLVVRARTVGEAKALLTQQLDYFGIEPTGDWQRYDRSSQRAPRG